MAVKIFFHICAITRAEEIVRNMVRIIQYSGLYDIVQRIYCYISGEEKTIIDVARYLQISGKKFTIIKVAPYDMSYERLTLEDIHNHVSDDDYILYIHTKGVSPQYQNKPDELKCLDDWRDIMLYYLVRHYQICLTHLKIYDTVGVNYRKGGWDGMYRPHWSGNFWWVRGDYFLKLPRKIKPDYFDPEQEFLFINNPKIFEMYGTANTNHNYERYEAYKYIDNCIQNIQNIQTNIE